MDNTESFLDSREDVLVLIPAAGLGTRVGSPPAKELMPHPQTGRPLMTEALLKVEKFGARPLVITREQKTELNQFLQKVKAPSIVLQEMTREWPETILKTEAYWRTWNFVLLPDTVYEPQSAMQMMWDKISLSRVQAMFATFPVDDFSTWGAVKTDRPFALCEKAQGNLGRSWRAWGIFAFHRSIGKELLQKMLASTFDHEIKDLPFELDFVTLSSFDDITRKLR